MKFRVALQAPQLNPLQIPLLDEFVEQSIKEAARIWVRAAVERIPVWSGASRATLQALADSVGEHIEIDVKGTAPDRIGLGRLYSRGGVEKTQTGRWQFIYETQLRYLITNETQNVKPRTAGLFSKLIEPTPYNFREAGNAAVQAYLKTIEPTLLKLQGRKI